MVSLAGLLTVGATLTAPTAWAKTASLPFGLYKSTNNLQYPFPATPHYAIQYYGWWEDFQTTEAEAAWRHGIVTFAELQTCDNPCDSTGVPVVNVIKGDYNSYLTRFARELKAFGHPVLVTFDHEMNGKWYPWGDTKISPTQWITAWHHVTTLINSIAPKAIWVWAPSVERGTASVARYWPGIGYANPDVDLVGLDGYFQNVHATWANTFTQSMRDVLKVSAGKYPFVVAETGVRASNSDKVAQIENLIAGARAAGAAAVMYFDKTKWLMDGAEQSAFIDDVSQPSESTPAAATATPAPNNRVRITD